ncbi:molybdate ABC transporter substrate-binding protein [Capnocytophaga haemolytica]|jgi:molybdate ABC transporter, periplasmic molybdate-binding protein
MKRIITLLILILTASAPLSAQNNSEITVAAAANLRYVLPELVSAYHKEYPKNQLTITYGASGTFTQQILNGAPFDLFLSADTAKPEKLHQAGKTVGEVTPYAYGKLALWSKNYNPSVGLKLLTDPKIKKIAIAKPELAPYGAAAVEALKKAQLYSKVENKIVWADNIGAAAQYAATGSADVGFIALSSAVATEMKGKGKYLILKEAQTTPIPQAAVVLATPKAKEAQHFLDYITNSKVQKIWQKYGYALPIKKK